MPNVDPLKERVPFSKKIHFPFELFRALPVQDADVLQEELQQLYFEQNPGEMQRVIERGKGNPDLVEQYKDELFNNIITTDYGYDTAILGQRPDDIMAQRLVEEINNYNVHVDRASTESEGSVVSE